MKINITNNYNPLYLFQNFKKTGASILSDLISDQKLIQSGSYNKLTAAYYKKKKDKKEKEDKKEYKTYNSSGELVKGLEE